MLVKDMEIGKLYKPIESCYYHESPPSERSDVPNGLIMVSLWTGNRYISNEKPIMIYLGSSKERYILHYHKKYHWFLCKGQRMVFNNYSFKYLEKVDEI